MCPESRDTIMSIIQIPIYIDVRIFFLFTKNDNNSLGKNKRKILKIKLKIPSSSAMMTIFIRKALDTQKKKREQYCMQLLLKLQVSQ